MKKIKDLEGQRILTNKEINPSLVREIELAAFTDEPPETREGIEKLLLHGVVLALDDEQIRAVVESISLPKLSLSLVKDLPEGSPLRMIVENDKRYGILRALKKDYPNHQDYHYIHGIAVNQKGIGYGSAMLEEEIRKTIGANDLMFGFVRAIPPNLPSIGMFLRKGAVIDKIEGTVYEQGKPYFRIVYGANIQLNQSSLGQAVILQGDHVDRIKELLKLGYIGKRFEAPNLLHFAKKS